VSVRLHGKGNVVTAPEAEVVVDVLLVITERQPEPALMDQHRSWRVEAGSERACAFICGRGFACVSRLLVL
jgi:hypothetical protein